jgi:hypothetical protein
MKSIAWFIVASAVLTTPLVLQAQQQKRSASTGGVSPHETTSAVIDGNRVTLTYGRPYTKDPKTGEPRKIWGGLVPWDKAWRTGADEATVLITEKPIAIGDTTIPAGAHTLYTVPSEAGASKLVFSTHLGKWGVPVDEKNDLARVEMKKEPLDNPVDQFTMAVAKVESGGGVIKLMWESTQFTVSFAVKK